MCMLIREELGVQLYGKGVEFGPGNYPQPLGSDVESIVYCDQHEDRNVFSNTYTELPEEQKKRFPSVIDYNINFDSDPFVSLLGKESFDFVIINHVLEHLVNPISFLKQCWEILKIEGLLLLTVPDHRYIFDRDRQRTTFEDVINRDKNNETELEAWRIEDFINKAEKPKVIFDLNSVDYDLTLEKHRKRSIHVNVWIMEDVIEIFSYLGMNGFPMKLINGICLWEFGLLFNKSKSIDVVKEYPILVQQIQNESEKVNKG